MVEAAGVEPFRVLITRNLLILGTATTAKKAPLPDPLYVYCTKTLLRSDKPVICLRPQYLTDPARTVDENIRRDLQQWHDRPSRACQPSRATRGMRHSAATGSAHVIPQKAFTTRPARA